MASNIELALMSGAAYESTRDKINRFPVPINWISAKHETQNSGFEAVAFVREGTTITTSSEIVISYAGTDPSDLSGDVAADFALALGAISDQLCQAAVYYLQIKAINPSATITFTGHSLGGGVASLMAVFFGESAYTFDQAPFLRSTVTFLTDTFGNPMTNSVAMDLRNYLAGKGFDSTNLGKLDAFIAAADSSNPAPIAADGLSVRQQKVTNINTEGEFLSSWYGVPSSNRIGSQADIVNSHDGLGVLGGIDLHAIELLTAFLQSDPTAATNTDVQAKSLNRVTYKLPDLLKMIFDKDLFAYDRGVGNKDNEDFLTRIVRHQAGTSSSSPSDAMVTRFTADLWKLAQDGGLTMTDGNEGNPDLHQVSNALIAFAMQKYYEEKDTSIGHGADLFTDKTGDIRFDMAAVSENFKNAFEANQAIDLNQAKGYVQYFDKYLDTTVFSPQERALIRSSLPWMRDWYVQAGTSGMTASDTQNRGAFMLGGSGSDTLTGGTANNLLVGNAGADTLKGGAGVDLLIGGADNDILEGGDSNDTLSGGQGNDTYKFTSGDGWDTVVDSDGLGHIEYDGVTLDGGQAVGNSGMVWQKKDVQGKVQFTYILTNWTEGTETYQRLSIQGKDGGLIVKGWNPGQLGITLAGAAQVTPPPVANPKVSNAGDTWYTSTHTILDGRDIGIATTAAVGAYGEVWANGNLLGNDFDNYLVSYAENDTLSGGKGRDVLLAGMGDDQLSGGEGDDALSGGDGDDLLEGNANNDALFGGIGRDLLIGGDGADALFGGATMQASDSGWSVIQNVFNHFDGEFASIGDGDDQLIGDASDDELLGGAGNDFLFGDGGNDTLYGGNGNDQLNGDSKGPGVAFGDDNIYGGDGNDGLFGEPPQKCSFSRMLRSTGKNGQKRNVSGSFDSSVRFPRQSAQAVNDADWRQAA